MLSATQQCAESTRLETWLTGVSVALAVGSLVFYVFWEVRGRAWWARGGVAHPLYIEIHRNHRRLRSWLRDLSEGGPIVDSYIDLEELEAMQPAFAALQQRIDVFPRYFPARLVQVYADLQRLPAAQEDVRREGATGRRTVQESEGLSPAGQLLRASVIVIQARLETVLVDLHYWAGIKQDIREVLNGSSDSGVSDRAREERVERRWWNRLPGVKWHRRRARWKEREVGDEAFWGEEYQ